MREHQEDGGMKAVKCSCSCGAGGVGTAGGSSAIARIHVCIRVHTYMHACIHECMHVPLKYVHIYKLKHGLTYRQTCTYGCSLG